MIDRLPYGIAYPIQRGQTGYFNPNYDSVDAVKNSIKNLLLTRKGSRPGRPSYGSSLWNFLFEQIEDLDDGFDGVFIENLKDEITQYHPAVTINDITFNASPDSNSITVEIKFLYLNSTTTDTLSFNISV